MHHFPVLSPTSDEMDILREEFDTLDDKEVDVESCSMTIDYKDSFGNQVKKTDYRMDKIWGNISDLKSAGSHRFSLLTKVASISLQ